MFRNFVAAIAIAASLFACAGPQAFAQPGPVPEVTIPLAQPTSTPAAVPMIVQNAPEPVVTVSDGLIAGVIFLAGWIIKLLAPTLNGIGAAIGVKAKAEDLANDAKWREAAKEISRTALSYALTAFKIDPKQLENIGVRASVLRHANDWIVRQYAKKGDYLEWVDQDQNGQIDFLEGVLSDAGLIPPVDHSQPPKPAAPLPIAA